MKKSFLVGFNILLYATLFNILPFKPLLAKGFSEFIFIAILWLTEAIPISITALLVPLCAAVTGILPLKQALSSFSTPVIFLFLAGFALAACLKKQELDLLLADKVILFAKGKLFNAIFLIFLFAAFMSMWMSNTATVAVMTPLALSLIKRSTKTPSTKVYVFTLLGLAYSSSTGGIATLVGSPPNAIVAHEMNLSFMDWIWYGLPASVCLLPLVIGILWLCIKPDLNQTFDFTPQQFEFTRSRQLTVFIALSTIALWIFSKPISTFLGGIKNIDVVIALFSIGMMGIFRVVGWKDIEKEVEWGVLLLFGGGLGLSAVLKVTGVSDYIAHSVSTYLVGTTHWVVFTAVALLVVFLTTLSSNTASAAILIPIFAPASQAMGVNPMIMAAMIGVAASCAFMLPISTPPNAIVYATGKVPMNSMMSYGLIISLSCIIILLLLAEFIWRFI
ncbi:DASS family sodium-coupled anion symporter [Parashewanella curva]|uniref:DASS family sodium-coupled anion symporter n=1 Tax=Parashewanella curva TaxID=2338552 RepID=A0A3L8PW81_9GAMM|nr:DASS family sodium-coupled anion symporter [Parashewanella curva]RLV59614.1 DASS family sodium-coupled anion symporter [Parashewanella curva]